MLNHALFYFEHKPNFKVRKKKIVSSPQNRIVSVMKVEIYDFVTCRTSMKNFVRNITTHVSMRIYKEIKNEYIDNTVILNASKGRNLCLSIYATV